MNATPVPRYSVLITSYRSLKFLPDLLGSVLAATGPTFEVLFLDNGSPDPEAEWIRENIHDPRLQVFKGETTRFFAGGMNFLTKRAHGEYLVMLNSDTRVEPDWLEKLDAYLQATGFDGAQADLREPAVDGFHTPTGYVLDPMGLIVETDKSLPATEPRFLICAAAFAIRREVFLEVGDLDESFRMYWEDIDLCWRINLAGYRIGYAPGAVVYHVGGGTSRAGFFKWTHFRVIRNRILSFTKNAEAGTLAAFLGITVLLRVATFPVNLVRGRWGQAVSEAAAVGSALLLWPKAFAKRAGVQKHRKVSDAELRARGFMLSGFKYSKWKELRNFLPARLAPGKVPPAPMR